ncbi:MAG: DUF2130 domain-containing protein [Mycoplasmataceae bacterium]|jgi:hypothetical protein|nr:DUF2130 domain-containing protein [Mycoplasmataceae bacterium]
MGKKIKVKFLNKTQLILEESADVNDIVDLSQIDSTLDQSSMDKIYQEIKNKEIEKDIQKRVLDGISLIKAQEQIKIIELQAKLENEKKSEISTKEKRIAELEIKNASIKENTELQMKNNLLLKEQEIKSLKELLEKKKFEMMSGTKDLGEDLEKYCQELYDNDIHPYVPKSEFHKFTKLVAGEKGDFVYYEDLGNNRFLTIMFEMKNKDDITKGEKNVKYYDKACSDRDNASTIEEYTHNQKCKYAVIVSMLEPNIDFDFKKVPGKENLFVIRPKFFKNIVSILRDKEQAIGNEVSEISNQLFLLKQDNSENDKFEIELTDAKKEALVSFKKVLNSMDDDAKDIVNIVKIAFDMFKRKSIEKGHVSKLFQRITKIKSKIKDTTELKELTKEVKEQIDAGKKLNFKQKGQKDVFDNLLTLAHDKNDEEDDD